MEEKFITQQGDTIENDWDDGAYGAVEKDIIENARSTLLGESKG